MRYRWLGSTGIRVSEIGFGAWAIGGAWWGPQDDSDSRLALHRSLDMGCDFIDTAWVYGHGHSERLIGSVLRERGQRPVIATKTPPKNWNWDPGPGIPLAEVFPGDWIAAKAEESLRNLGVERLDLLQLHTWHREWNGQSGPLLDAVARLKRAGKIRAFGISLRDKGSDDANDLVRWRQVDSLQIFFNLFYQEPLERVFPLARQYGVGIIARVPLAFGALTGRFNAKTRFIGDDHRRRLYEGAGLKTTLAKVSRLGFLTKGGRSLGEAALKWTLAFPEVSTSIPGVRNLRQAQWNMSAGDGPGLSKEEVGRTRKLYAANFGQALRKVPSGEGVPAVFMSGVRVPRPSKTAFSRPQRGRGGARKKTRGKGRKK